MCTCCPAWLTVAIGVSVFFSNRMYEPVVPSGSTRTWNVAVGGGGGGPGSNGPGSGGGVGAVGGGLEMVSARPPGAPGAPGGGRGSVLLFAWFSGSAGAKQHGPR